MTSLFEVNGINRFENNKKMVISVYGTRTAKYDSHEAEFLLYQDGMLLKYISKK